MSLGTNHNCLSWPVSLLGVMLSKCSPAKQFGRSRERWRGWSRGLPWGKLAQELCVLFGPESKLLGLACVSFECHALQSIRGSQGGRWRGWSCGYPWGKLAQGLYVFFRQESKLCGLACVSFEGHALQMLASNAFGEASHVAVSGGNSRKSCLLSF